MSYGKESTQTCNYTNSKEIIKYTDLSTKNLQSTLKKLNNDITNSSSTLLINIPNESNDILTNNIIGSKKEKQILIEFWSKFKSKNKVNLFKKYNFK